MSVSRCRLRLVFEQLRFPEDANNTAILGSPCANVRDPRDTPTQVGDAGQRERRQ
jgi:hypothetical protein